jgi:hypothetical protein
MKILDIAGGRGYDDDIPYTDTYPETDGPAPYALEHGNRAVKQATITALSPWATNTNGDAKADDRKSKNHGSAHG